MLFVRRIAYSTYPRSKHKSSKKSFSQHLIFLLFHSSSLSFSFLRHIPHPRRASYANAPNIRISLVRGTTPRKVCVDERAFLTQLPSVRCGPKENQGEVERERERAIVPTPQKRHRAEPITSEKGRRKIWRSFLKGIQLHVRWTLIYPLHFAGFFFGLEAAPMCLNISYIGGKIYGGLLSLIDADRRACARRISTCVPVAALVPPQSAHSVIIYPVTAVIYLWVYTHSASFISTAHPSTTHIFVEPFNRFSDPTIRWMSAPSFGVAV